MRRLAAFLGLVALLAGCSGEEGLRAQRLLLDADAAHARLSSATFSVDLAFDVMGQKGAVVLDGGGYLKGKRAGDAVLRLRTEGLPSGFTFTFVTRGREAYLGVDGEWQRYPLATGARSRSGSLDLRRLLRFGRHVKDVDVAEGTPIDGEPTTRISGVLDTKALLRSLEGLGSLPGAARLGSFDASDLAAKIGDVHAILLVSDRTKLVRMAIVELELEAGGESMELKLVYRLTGANRPVAIPVP
jgi:hypothetical protein